MTFFVELTLRKSLNVHTGSLLSIYILPSHCPTQENETHQKLHSKNYNMLWDRPYKTLFSSFSFFSVKLGHFTINDFFLCLTNIQGYQQKTEKILR